MNGGEAGTAIESTTPDGRDTFRDGDGGEARAITVFVTHCVSAIFDYNGRKVMA